MLSVIRKMATACVVCALCVSVGFAFNSGSRSYGESCYSPGDCGHWNMKDPNSAKLTCVETGSSSNKSCSCRLKNRGGDVCRHR